MAAKAVEVFFDYTCPYCDCGIRQLLEILPDYPEVELVWKPCEAHPRPEPAGMHSDLAIQVMYFLRDQGLDVVSYHKRIFDACFRQRRRIDEPEMLADLAAECGADRKAVLEALRENRYAAEVEEGNRYAWEENKLSAVPSYRSGRRVIGSRDGILVPIEEVMDLLEAVNILCF